MKLTPKQVEKYTNKLRCFGLDFILNENGVFVCESNLTEEEVKHIVECLRVAQYVRAVNYFNIFQNKKRQHFLIQGILKDNLNEAVEIHDELNPKIWTKEKELIPEVRAKILQIVDKFKSLLAVDEVELKVDDIYLLGSNANFNYNEDSDLDIHIIADETFDCSQEHLKTIYDCYKALFNNKYDINIKGINVELYVENKDKLTNVSAGIYSFKDGWIRSPSKFKIPEFDQIAVDRGVKLWEDKYFDITLNPTVKKIDDYLDSIYELRKESIQKDGEFGEGNLVFKEIRRLGYLDDLRELKIQLTSQELSLESLEEGQEKIRFYYRGPVYHFEHILSRDWEAYTEAVSEKQALNNLTVKAKNYFGYILQSRITLDPKYLEVSPKLEPEDEFKETPKCEKCGRPLTHSGECPLCDLGDESVLDESKKEEPKEYWEDEMNRKYFDDEILNNKVFDWFTSQKQWESQEYLDKNYTWKDMIKNFKKENLMGGGFDNLDTAVRDVVYEKVCELYQNAFGEPLCKSYTVYIPGEPPREYSTYEQVISFLRDLDLTEKGKEINKDKITIACDHTHDSVEETTEWIKDIAFNK